MGDILKSALPGQRNLWCASFRGHPPAATRSLPGSRPPNKGNHEASRNRNVARHCRNDERRRSPPKKKRKKPANSRTVGY